MARSRNIKPAFFDNDSLAENDPFGRLLFIGMWTIADYKGEFEWREKRIKAKILPFDNCNVKELAINLDKSGFIRFYSEAGKIYCNVVNFVKHQNPHKNERIKGSDIPNYSEKGRQLIDLKELTINLDKNGLNPEDSTIDPADSLDLNPESLILIPEPLIPKKPTVDFSLFDMCSDEQISEIKRIRRKNNTGKAGTFTNRIVKSAAKQFSLSIQKGWTVEELLTKWEDKGWRTLEADYLETKFPSHTSMDLEFSEQPKTKEQHKDEVRRKLMDIRDTSWAD